MRELVCLGISHHDAHVSVRERLALSPGEVERALVWLRERNGISGTAILSTCNRAEFYAVADPAIDFRQLLGELFEFLKRPSPHEIGQLRSLVGREVVEHLFRVASGLESMVIGETEILGQMKQAYGEAHRLGTVSKVLHRLFQSAFRAAKEVRHKTEVTRGGVSVAAVAVELAEKIFGSLGECRVVLIGAGDTGEKTARAMFSRGLQGLVVTNRTFERAVELADRLGGAAVPLSEWRWELLFADIVVAATAAEQAVVREDELGEVLKRRGRRSLFLIDLSVPRGIDPGLARHDGVYLYNVDDLQGIADQHLADRQGAITTAEAILERHANEFVSWREAERRRSEGGMAGGPPRE
ncbi:MAG TPA: glutamyl-tRNA reductase [Verrucomicrobiae bacterium]|nr:glutamyl-tRNA reductase [Verrucomicrobiae bacterium]